MNELQAYTLKQTAKLLACSMPTIYRLINSGQLKTFSMRGDQRIAASEILKFQQA